MNYQNILVLGELGVTMQATVATVSRFVPSATQVTIIAQQPTRQLAWLTHAAPPDLNEAMQRAFDELWQAAKRIAPAANVTLAADLTVGALAKTVAASASDLVVVGSLQLHTLSLVAELRRQSAVAVLCIRSAAESGAVAGVNRLLCVGLSARGRSAVMAFLRDQAGPADRIALLLPGPLSAEDLAELREVLGIACGVDLVDGSGKGLRQLLDPRAAGIDLVVLPHFPPLVLLPVTSGPAVLVLPPLRAPARDWERAIDLPDLVDDGALIRARLEYAIGVGRRTPIADQEVAFVHEAKVVARATSRGGDVELPRGIWDSLGVFRTQGKAAADPVASIEARAGVLRANSRPMLLFDAEMADDELLLLRNLTWADAIGVRVRSMRSCAALRGRLQAASLPDRVIDVSAVLGEGEGLDVPALADAVRLARAAARMRADGFAVAAVAYRGPHKPATHGFAALRAEEVGAPVPMSTATITRASLSGRLNCTTGSEPIAGNSVEVELDNRTARSWLLSAIEGSRQRVHFQVYMATDDDVGRMVEAALVAAAARGVTVRMLVDSLHGHHGSFGLHNPILQRLGASPGIELRVSKPVTTAPSLEDLKQRDHRKLVVVDGQVAFLGGRNLSHEYYAGFQEVPLTANMTWRMVPWLDAGARVEGPAVAVLERSFMHAWTEAGGEWFTIGDVAPTGSITARVVVHHGLRDAYTLEAYLALIDAARSYVYAVNGFPLMLEIQHALLRALRRGVRVRTLFGNLTPMYGEEHFKGPWAVARTAATWFVHSRMDALAAAGGECYELVVPKQPGWDPAVVNVRPHVHAKLLCADGQVCAVGSSNLDITAGYWESELLLVVENEYIARTVEARIDALLADSARVNPDDPVWRHRAEERQWLRYWPGVLSV